LFARAASTNEAIIVLVSRLIWDRRPVLDCQAERRLYRLAAACKAQRLRLSVRHRAPSTGRRSEERSPTEKYSSDFKAFSGMSEGESLVKIRQRWRWPAGSHAHHAARPGPQLAFRENFSWRANAALELFIARHTTIDPIRRANLFHETADDRGPI